MRNALLAFLAIGGLFLTTGLALWAEPATPAELAPYPRLDAETLRKQFPFVSLADRLRYERERTPADGPPKLSAAAAKTLDNQEAHWKMDKVTDHRVRSLAMLHQVEVEKFVERENFGRLRMMAAGPQFVELRPTPPIPFPSEVRQPLTDEAAGPPAALPRTAATAPAAARFPALDSLGSLHASGLWQFASPRTNGLIQGRDKVAGFEPHQFRALPQLHQPAADGKERWLLGRLELVSLLKHDQPAVYVSEHLPRMDALQKAQTRPLNAFETKALPTLRAGEDLVTEASTNRITMMGAVRAGTQCLDCHHTQRGALLGTFSYELRRHPPVSVTER